MKKKVMLALAIVMVLGSINAMAEEVDEIHQMITEGKIQAAEAANRCMECDLHAYGKLDAAELQMNLVTIKSQIAEMEKMQQELSDVENTRGVLSALGQTITMAEDIFKEIDQNNDLEKSRILVKDLDQIIGQLKVRSSDR